MMDWKWIFADQMALVMVAISGVGIYAALLVLTRFSGLRSFSKMSSFDFAITVSIGSVIAGTVLTRDPPLVTCIFALTVLYALQYTVSKIRRRSALFERLVDNRPMLLMAGEKVLSEHLAAARMTEEDLKSHLRTAGVTHPSQVAAVVFETTGDVAVMWASDELDMWLLEGVRGTEHLRAGVNP